MIPDWRIKELMEEGQIEIEPFVDHKCRTIETAEGTKPALSYGLSSCGYDIRLGHALEIYTDARAFRGRENLGYQSDPMAGEEASANLRSKLKASDHNPFWIPPSGYALGVAIERIRLGPRVSAIVVVKSSYARAGLFANLTPIEPGWNGYLTLELKNELDMPLLVYPGMGICQVLFTEFARPVDVPYGDGKFQDQPNRPIGPRV